MAHQRQLALDQQEFVKADRLRDIRRQAYEAFLSKVDAAYRLIPLTIPELVRLLRGELIPQPRRDRAHRNRWSIWRRHHQYQARQSHQRWSVYAETPPW